MRKSRKTAENRKITVIALACSFAMAFPFAAFAGTDQIKLEQEAGSDPVAVTIGMDHAYEEGVTAASIMLNVEVEKGKEDVSFSFSDELDEAVTGYRYSDGYLYLYVASNKGIFDAEDELYLGELTVDAKTSEGLTAAVSYVDGSFQTANAAYGGKNIRPLSVSAPVTVNQDGSSKPETPETPTTPDPGNNSGNNSGTGGNSGNTENPGNNGNGSSSSGSGSGSHTSSGGSGSHSSSKGSISSNTSTGGPGVVKQTDRADKAETQAPAESVLETVPETQPAKIVIADNSQKKDADNIQTIRSASEDAQKEGSETLKEEPLGGEAEVPEVNGTLEAETEQASLEDTGENTAENSEQAQDTSKKEVSKHQNGSLFGKVLAAVTIGALAGIGIYFGKFRKK